MDFIDLNKVCPKDAKPLPCIDKLVDGALEAKFLSSMDAYSGYNYIKMHIVDKEKMTFIIEKAIYCHKVMTFRLKNARATYQRLMNLVFPNQIGRIMEVYVDDKVAKTTGDGDHCKDLCNIPNCV